MQKNGKNPSQFHYTDDQIDIINEITIVIATLFHNFITDHKEFKKMIEPFSRMHLHGNDNDKDLARLGLTLNLRNMSHKEGGMFPNQINKELARVLLKGSNDVFLGNQSTLAKVSKEFEDANILFRIEGKKNIKHQSPKSIPRGLKARGAKREGYHIVRKVTSTVEDYEKILSNPNALSLINKNLKKYGKLKDVYELFSKDVFELLKKADPEFYNILPVFGEIFPEIKTDAMPDPQIFQEAIKSVGEDDFEQLRKEFVNHLIENPLSGLFFMSSLSGLENND